MAWSSAFYFGGGETRTVKVPVTSITFEARDTASFVASDDAPRLMTVDPVAAFDFSGEPRFTPLNTGAQFDADG